MRRRVEEEQGLPFASPTIDAVSPSSHANYLDDAFLDRVRRAYQLSASKLMISSDSMWMDITTLNRPVHDALMAPDRDSLRCIFEDPSSSDLYYGVDNLSRTLAARAPDWDGHLVEQSRGCLLLLAEALGIRRWLPPGAEQEPNYYPSDHEVSPDIDNLVASISESLGFDVRFPNPFRGEVGVMTSRGAASYRAIQALYQCHRIKQELFDRPAAAILEIGPGAGRTAFYARQAGMLNYATIDLPLGVVAQACFLGATVGPDAIWMIGDEPDMAAGRIRLFPSSVRDSIQERFALILNVDSMTEMGFETSADFAIWIATHADLFLSVNHEANGPTIADLSRRHFPRRGKRFPYWMRHGYVEEIFDFLKETPNTSEAENLRCEISALYASTSWRITAPLRAFRRALAR